MFKRSAILLTLCLATFTAQATLVGRAASTPGGTDYQAYYDDVLNITWMADANLAATNTFGVTGINANGAMRWSKAQEWVGAMNTATHLGVSGWRVPTVTDVNNNGCSGSFWDGGDCGYNLLTKSGNVNQYEAGQTVYSEMGHMFYSTLGNIASYDTSGVRTPCSYFHPDECLTNRGPFSNLKASVYLTGTIYAPNPGEAWIFVFGNGGQGHDLRTDLGYEKYAWAVTSGDPLNAVPIPPAVWLFGSALGLMGVMRRKISA